jgi:hypothetical protein
LALAFRTAAEEEKNRSQHWLLRESQFTDIQHLFFPNSSSDEQQQGGEPTILANLYLTGSKIVDAD